MLAYRTTTGSAPSYFHSLMTIYIPSRSLRSASERRLVVPSQRESKSLSRTFSFTVPGWWNELQGMNAESLTIFKQHLETHLFRHLKKKPFLNFALFPLTSHCLAKICSDQCLEILITSTSCLCLPLYNDSLIVFLNCKSLWIKVSAKWVNVNVNANIYIYMKSSFPKRDKRQILKKWVRHAILLCTEPIHCSINVSCQIAIFPCLKCTSLSWPHKEAL